MDKGVRKWLDVDKVGGQNQIYTSHCFWVENQGISDKPLVFSLYTHKPLDKSACKENTSVMWDIPW